MRVGDPPVMAVLAALVGLCHLLVGFTNHELTDLVGALLDSSYGSRQATYDLRRLLPKGLIERIPGTQRYLLTPLGRRVGVLFTKASGRVLAPGLAVLDPALASELVQRTPLAVAWRGLNQALDALSIGRCLLPEP